MQQWYKSHELSLASLTEHKCPQKLDLTQDVTDYANLTPAERRAFDGILSYLTFLDSIQTCNLPHVKSAVTAPEVSLCLAEQISQECFDEQTEILTDQGWKLFSELQDDLVAQYDLESRAISFVRPSRIVKKYYSGEMVAFESGHTSILVTPNHEMITIAPSSKKVDKRLASSIKGGNHSYPKVGQFTGGFYKASKLFHLLIAVAADGSIREFTKTENKTSNVSMALTKPRKINRLRQLLSDLSIPFTEGDKKGGRVFYFNLPEYMPKEGVKALDFIPVFSLTKESALELLQECTFWDGSTSNWFYSTNTSAVDKVQTLAMVAGKNATIGINRTAEQSAQTSLPQGKIALSAKTCYVVTFSDGQNKKYPKPTQVDYSGMVYCVTVDKGNIVTRRNGRIAIAGNCMHNQSYQFMIESIIPSDRRDEVYYFWRTDDVLRKRCENIAAHYQKYLDNPSQENYFTSLVADYLLEGLFFYPGFLFFYNLASRMLMPGSADIFKLINRDELSHVRLFQKLVTEAMTSFDYDENVIYEMVDKAVQHECEWTNHIIGDDILGITKQSTEIYTKYLANNRLKDIGLKPLYEGDIYKKSPYRHLEKFSDTKGGGHTKANFFEAGVTSYVMSSGVTGWDEI